MNSVVGGLAALAVGTLVVLGVVQVATGWAPRWVRDVILRPRLSGAATVVQGVGLGVFLFFGPLGGMPPRHTALPFVGLAVGVVVGSGLQRLARRPRRVTGLPTASS